MVDATWYGNTEGDGESPISGSALHSLHSRVSDLSYNRFESCPDYRRLITPIGIKVMLVRW